MHCIRYKRNLQVLPWLLAVTVVLRSFIAPGYMLTTSAESGLGIIFCDGPVSISPPKDIHGAHHHHAGHDQVRTDVHISPVCSDWSTSSLLVFSKPFELTHFSVQRVVSVLYYSPSFRQHYFDNVRLIRGPPALV